MPRPAEGKTAPSGSPQFSDLLRNWRKVRKVSQWDLALETGISQRHLSFLESGRSSPSRDMVIRLAGSLELPLREQNGLLSSAGFAAAYSQSSFDADSMQHANHALSIMLKHHEPYPAVVVDRNWNILMMNEANLKVFGLFMDVMGILETISPGKQPNLARLTLHQEGAKPYISNWDEIAGYFLQQLSSELNANPYNTEARELLDEIMAYPDIPDAHFVPSGVTPYIEFKLQNEELDLAFFSVVSTFGTPQDVTLQEIRIETFFASNEATETFLRTL